MAQVRKTQMPGMKGTVNREGSFLSLRELLRVSKELFECGGRAANGGTIGGGGTDVRVSV